jgi:AcrR family transcriptional regulator
VAFATRGYERSTNRSLSEAVGVTPAAVYHYFESKLDLYLAVHEDVQREVYQRFREASAVPTTFRGKLDAVLERSHEMNKADPSLAQFLGSVRVDMRRHPVLAEVLQDTAAAREQFIEELVDAGVASGEIAPGDRRRASALVLTLLIGLADAVAADVELQRSAIDAIDAMLDQRLIRPAIPPG